jgi:hypothetical protein
MNLQQPFCLPMMLDNQTCLAVVYEVQQEGQHCKRQEVRALSKTYKHSYPCQHPCRHSPWTSGEICQGKLQLGVGKEIFRSHEMSQYSLWSLGYDPDYQQQQL